MASGLKIHAFRGLANSRSGESPGWYKTNASAVLAVLLAKYSDFGWPEIEEFKALNDIEDYQPDQELNPSDFFVGGNGSGGTGPIYLPSGFDLSGWQPIYNEWKAGYVVAELPPKPVAPSYTPPAQPTAPAYTQPQTIETSPEYAEWFTPDAPAPATQPPSQQSYSPTPTPAPAPAPVQPSPTVIPAQPVKPGTQPYAPTLIPGVPNMLLLAGAGVAAYFMLSKKKGR